MALPRSDVVEGETRATACVWWDIQNWVARGEFRQLGDVFTWRIASFDRCWDLPWIGPRTIIPDVLEMSAVRRVPVKQKAPVDPYKRNSPFK